MACAALVFTTDAARATVLGHWLFDDASGTTALDVSGNARHGTLVNFANTSAGAGNAGVSGWTGDGRLAFDGTNDHLTTTGFSLNLLIGTSFTLEAIVSHDNPTQTWSPILGESNSGLGGILFFGKQQNTNAINYNFAGLGNGNTGIPFADGNMHHLAMVFDDTANTLTLYVDYVQRFQAINITGTLTTTSDLLIGATGHSAVERWNGLADEIRISDEALAPAQFIPEPTSALLAAFGAGLFLARRRR